MKIWLFGVLIVVTGLSSCKDYLNIDKYFDDEFKIDSAFVSTRYMEAYMWGAAALFPDEAATVRANYTPGILATDEGANNYRASGNVYYGLDFASGIISPDYYGRGSSNLNTWGTYYKIIRKTNSILANLDEPKDLTIASRNRIEGNTRFIRAYAYYNLILDYGPPILLGDEIIHTNEAIEYYDRERSTYDEAIEYICAEFEKAAKLLPLQISTIDLGKPTKGAALSLIARLRLIHASPLFNGGFAARSFFGNWKRSSDGVFYVSQTYDEKRWAVAAAAAKKVIDLSAAGGALYSLNTVLSDDDTPDLPANVTSDPSYYENFPNGANGIDPYRSYSEMFNGEAIAATVPEFIWAKNASSYINDQINKGAFPKSLGGWNRFCLTQKVVDAFLMNDGRTKEEALGDSYFESGFTTTSKVFSGYTLPSGIFRMYDNREPRFYASVGFDGAIWEAGSSIDFFDHPAQYYFDGTDGRQAAPDDVDYPLTGYVIKKFVHPMDAFRGSGNRRTPKVYPIIRYAEILLSYAEALNNLTGSHTIEDEEGGVAIFDRNVEEIADAFNQVRYRAGLPGLSQTQLADPESVQSAIERERMVEFLWENRRYYDVRRWGIYEETEREPLMGMNVDGGRSTFYQRVIPSTSQIKGRVVDKKLVFLPIPRSERRRLPSLDQNPGW